MSDVKLGTVSASVRIEKNGLRTDVNDIKSLMKQMADNMETATERAERRATAAVAAQAARRAAILKEYADKAAKGMTLVGTAVAAGLAAATKQAADFDQAMRNVNSIAKLSEKQFRDLSGSVKKLADDPSIRQAPEDLAKGLYDVYSSGFEGQKALDILRTAAVGASAGMTDTATSSKVLMSVLNSGIKGVTSTGQAMDILFQEVNLGVNSFEGLAGALGDVLPTAKTAGVSLQEVTASLATMTRQGINVNESTTALNGLLIHLIKPGKDAAELMNRLGIEYGINALQAKGLTGVLQDIMAKTHGNQQALVQLMPEVRALKALLALTGGDMRQYSQMLEGMSNKTQVQGAAQRAANEQNKGAVAQFQLLKKEISLVAISIGEVLLPKGLQLLQWTKNLIAGFAQLSPATKENITQMALYGAGTLLAGGAALKLGLALVNLQKAFVLLGVAEAAATFGPFLVGVAAVGAATAGLIYVLDKFFNVQEQSTEELKREAQQLADAAKKKAQNAGETKNLITRYEQLKAIAKPTTEQQQELHDVLNKISMLSPGLVSGFDRQGNALGVVSNAAQRAAGSYRELAREAQIAAAKVFAVQVSENVQKRSDLSDELNKQKGLLTSGQFTRKVTERGYLAGPGGGVAYDYDRDMTSAATPAETAQTAARVRDLTAQIAALDQQKQGMNAQMREALGHKTEMFGPPVAGKGKPHQSAASAHVNAILADMKAKKGHGRHGKTAAERAAAKAERDRESASREAAQKQRDEEQLNDEILAATQGVTEAQIERRRIGRRYQENLRNGMPPQKALDLWTKENAKVDVEQRKQTETREMATQDIMKDVAGASKATGGWSIGAAFSQWEKEKQKQKGMTMLGRGLQSLASAKESRDAEARQEQEKDEARREAEQKEQQSLDRRKDWEAQYNLISLTQYKTYLQRRLGSMHEYSEEWMAVQGKIFDIEAKQKEAQDKLNEEKGRKWKEMAGNFKTLFATAFEEMLTRGKNFFQSFLDGFKQMLAQMIAQAVAAKITDAIFGSGEKKEKQGKKKKGGLLSGLLGDEGGGLLGAALGVFGFDDAHNDRIAERWGRDAAAHFKIGVQDYTRQRAGSLSGAGAGAAAAPVVHIHMGTVNMNSAMDVEQIGRELAWHIQTKLPTTRRS